MDAIFRRVSIRKFQSAKVEEPKIDKLLRAAMAAPSGGNQQPWEFLVVDDPKLCEKLGETSKFSKPAAAAPLNIVPIMDRRDARFPQITEQDMSACVENILLEAVDQGLGAVWMGVYPSAERMDYIRDLFGIGEEYEPFAIIAVGYPQDEVHDQQDRYDESRIHRNVW